MNTFVNSISTQETRTLNDMKALAGSGNANVDLFFKAGAMRGQDIVPNFVAAFVENSDYALRIAQWMRDVRGGAGERQLFKNILSYLEKHEPILAMKLITKIPEIGRWDDMLINYTNKDVRNFAFAIYREAIYNENGLAAKWAPRKGLMAVMLRNAWGMTPKQYRKTLVSLTNVVENAMCQKEWNSIDFSKIPSLAHARYRKAFIRNSETYDAYVKKLTEKDTSVKINAGAVYPYDVIKTAFTDTWYGINNNLSKAEVDVMIAQWEAQKNSLGSGKVLPMVDVSGSMTVGINNTLTALQVAVSLGLYCADKNTGVFKDVFLTFSATPELMKLQGNIYQKLMQMSSSSWGMNTNLHAAFNKVLDLAVCNKVPAEDMPETILILSDMQFDRCVSFDDSAIEMIRRKYESAGYSMPNIVFWNLVSYGNVPVKFNEQGVALVSGFSPSILKSVVTGDEMTPEAIMLKTIMSDRYTI